MQHQTWRYRTYTRLLLRDVVRSMRRLVRSKRTRQQIVLTFTRPSFVQSRRYLTKLRAARSARRGEWRRAVVTLVMLIGGAVGLIGACVQLQTFQPTTVTKAAPVEIAKPEVPKSMKHSVPVRLEVADVGITTELIQLGTNPDGSLETPTSYEVAGWYKYSPTPGEIGPAVITGHVDNYKGPAVFFRLKEMVPGQKVRVTRTDGSVAVFTVSRLAQFDQDNFPTDDVYGNTSDAQLRLITCGGAFNHLTGHYTQNTVVYAVLDRPS